MNNNIEQRISKLCSLMICELQNPLFSKKIEIIETGIGKGILLTRAGFSDLGIP